ncbi:Low temperature viability protein [Hypoxylon trugodes]|uniref:Low temperature viability protein n=1 Tax=Hypoxylon trugodes TaxID=326681 RepID=UPI00218FE9CE|nr:Low temperature viability protein [Hypoxylon trugodes]KAI1390854.1 Low temperature viability protein [Hypoxylon trugodes]
MPKGKWIDKKTAQHFTLVHRPQNDPLIHDTESPSMILNPTALPNASKVRKLDDLASELGSDAERIRANEGEAANYGVYFDDTEYDYMKHLRDLDSGNGAGEVVFVEADSGNKNKNKGKQKQSLEDALRKLDVEDEERKKGELFGDDFLPSKNLQHITYQAQQDIPDAIGGFQPDMDPRLREVLEALEDEAYVDDDEDVFAELAKDGKELDDIEFDEEFDEDDGWESDDTAKPTKEYKDPSEAPELVPATDGEDGGAAVKNENWLEDFKKFKKDQGKSSSKPFAAAPSQSDLQSSLMTTTTNGGRRKKRKGALTSQSGYSMTSASLVRTEQLGILDARFEKIDEQYNEGDFEDGDDAASMSQVSAVSSVTGPVRNDFDNILDDFLGGYSMHGKKQLKKGKWKSGTAQLDEIRRELGPARVSGRYSQPQGAPASASVSR